MRGRATDLRSRMSEPHAEPAADVRSFLPRPGEPVEDYAARLRALHHDLSLVLDAVERGLAAAERHPAPAEGEPPADARQAVAPGSREGARRGRLDPARGRGGRARVDRTAGARRGSARGRAP